jgi:SAM-dependent methyltransferase
MSNDELSGTREAAQPRMIEEIARYWNERIHDLEMTDRPVGTLGFFNDLDEYRFDKLRYLPKLVDFGGYRDRRVLEVGCGIGTDLVRFARGGARVTGVDLAPRSIELAQANVELHGLGGRADLRVANGEALPFDDDTFEVVYGHGVLQYTADARRMVEECRRVLEPGGEAIFMVYNRISWLNALSHVMGVGLEHADAPVLRKYSIPEFRRLLDGFGQVSIVPERFPVRSRLHTGWKGTFFNRFFVGTFNTIPRPLVRRFGWHLMAFCRK